MRGQMQCTCSRCGLEKGDRESNTGWWEMKPRGPHHRTTHWFCPGCSATLLVAVDGALEGKLVEHQRVVQVQLLARIAAFLELFDARRAPIGIHSDPYMVNELKRLAREVRAFVPNLVVRRVSPAENPGGASTPQPASGT